MKRFVYGTDYDWKTLANDLSRLSNENRMDVYTCMMPAECEPKYVRIAFEKRDNSYFIYIDKTVHYEGELEPFKRFLDNRELMFENIEEVRSFFESLSSLYSEESDIGLTSERTTALYLPEHALVNYEAVKEELSRDSGKKNYSTEIIVNDLKNIIAGQDEAIQMLADVIVIGLNKKKSKIINVSFLGPTATGKSETARALAQEMSKLTGKKYGFIECAGNEFVSEHMVHRFLGAPPGYTGYGKATILDPVRKNPYHVIVINEVEKADDRLLIALMEAIDTGYLGMADNSKAIDLNKCILIFTSNLKIDMDIYEKLNDYEKTEMCMDAFTEHCSRPEISGKISNYIVFKQLSDEANIAIVEKFAVEVFDNFDIELVEIEPKLVKQFIQYKTSYGARAIRTMVDRVVGRQLLHSGQIEKLKHKKVRMVGDIENISFEAV